MAWSMKLLTFAGVPVRIHFTFFLLLAWFAIIYYMRGGWPLAVDGLAFILLLFVSVVLHEFGHIFAARRYGIGTSDVTLLPIGGVASMERIPEKPGQEIIIALAGPAVNVVIAALLFLLVGLPQPPSQEIGGAQEPNVQELALGLSLFQRVALANVVLAVFNLIPAFPMDGGRVLRAILATQLGYLRATRVAAVVGQALAVGFAFLGLFGSPLLVLVAIFVFLAASGEASIVEARTVARGYVVGDAMITTFERLLPSATADDAAALLLRTTQQEFPVVEGNGAFAGFVTRQGLIQALQDKGGATPVAEFMERGAPLVSRTTCLDRVMELLGARQVPAVGVSDDGVHLLGYITAENLSELLMIRGARENHREPRAMPAH